MKRIIHTLFIFISLFSFLSCNKESPEHKTDDNFKTNDGFFYETPLGSFKLSERTIFLTDQGEGSITITDNSTLTLDKEVFRERTFAKKGDIILYTNTGDVPKGFLGQIEEIDDNGNEVVFHTSTVNLDDVFDEIHIEGNARFPGEVANFLDENGEKLSCSIVDNSIWDTLDGYELIESSDTSETKSSIGTKAINAEGQVEQTFEFKIKAGEQASGKIYLGLGIHATINKDTGGKLECDFSVPTKIGIKGKITLKNIEKKIPFLQIKRLLPMDVIVGPLILTPQLVLENGIKANAEVSLESDLSMGLFSMVFKAGYYNDAPHFAFEPSPSSDSYFKVISLEGSAGLSLYTNVAIEMDAYGMRDILAVGIEGQEESQISLNGKISFESKDLLSLNPDLSIGKSRTVGAYVHSLAFKLLGAPDGKFSASKSFDAGVDIGLFPELVNNTTTKVNSGIRATASGVKKGLTAVAEHGFALFERDKAVEHRNLMVPETKASIDGPYTEFNFPDDDSDYSVKEYVKVKNSEGEHYFYKEIKRNIRSLTIDNYVKFGAQLVGSQKMVFHYNEKGQLESLDNGDGREYQLEYDDNGRIVKLIRKEKMFFETMYSFDYLPNNIIRATSDGPYSYDYHLLNSRVGQIVVYNPIGYSKVEYLWQDGNCQSRATSDNGEKTNFTYSVGKDLIHIASFFSLINVTRELFLFEYAQGLTSCNNLLSSSKTISNNTDSYSEEMFFYSLDKDSYPVEVIRESYCEKGQQEYITKYRIEY